MIQLTIPTGQRISNTLLLNASFIDNLGLMHGKMGISIYFFHLARQTGNQIYEDYAGELIDEIYEEITANTPVDFENGLAGIGWGIEYLVQNGFIEADTDEVLEEFDNRIFKELIYNTPQDIGLLNGLVGIGAYFLKRIKNKASNDEKILTITNKQTLIHIIDELDRKTQNIPEIISEPLSEKSPSVKPSNLETHEPPNEKRQTTNHEPQTTNKLFDLTWDYPALLWFFAELYEQNIFNFKVEKIIKRLTEPLSNESNFPKLQSNRLLLALALTKLQQKHETITANKKQRTINDDSQFNSRTFVKQLSNLQTIINNLLTGINRNTIKFELSPNNATLRYGTSGVAWIYQQLHRQTSDNHFKEEMEYWANLNLIPKNIEELFFEVTTESTIGYGILEGFSGIFFHSNFN
ncbi:MAG: hypothetical protein K0B11_19335 [Mariniphaga sp.]|nr:hypothetical protein [Mariniphaga sp.]